MRCLLVGNYGVGNLGDEALKEYFLMAFADVEWTVLSASPAARNEVPRLPFGLRSFFGTAWWKTVRALFSCDAVVFGGGSLFTDVESPRACLIWWWHGFVPWLFRKPVLLAFQGIGPFRTGVGEWCAHRTVKRAAFVSVRDTESAARIRTWSRARIIVSFDPVLSLFSDAVPHVASADILAVIPRANAGDGFRALVMAAAERHSTKAVNIISLEPGSAAEQALCRSLAEDIGPRCSVCSAASVQELAAALAGSSLVISARYHGALAALALGIPVEIVPQAAGDKLDALRTLQMEGIDALRQRVREGEEELRKYMNML